VGSPSNVAKRTSNMHLNDVSGAVARSGSPPLSTLDGRRARDKAHATATRTSCLVVRPTGGHSDVPARAHPWPAMRAMASAARDTRATASGREGRVVCSPSPGCPFPVGFLSPSRGRTGRGRRPGPNSCVWRWSCRLRQVGRRARPPWCCGGVDGQGTSARPRQTGRDGVPAIHGPVARRTGPGVIGVARARCQRQRPLRFH
jgi:hypothetical protein